MEEIDKRGRHHRTTRNKDERRGTPQGAPLSPLLSNLYMRRFVLGWKVLGHERRLDAHIVNYADDFVICCRGTADEAMTAMRAMMSKLKLTVNETKTRRCQVPDETFDFLGYTIGLCHPTTGKSYIGTQPSAKKVKRLCREISELTRGGVEACRAGGGPPEQETDGWANYFRLGTVSKAYGVVNHHATNGSVTGCVGSTRCGVRDSRFPDGYLHQTLGLSQLRRVATQHVRERTRESLSESRVREIRQHGSMSGMWKRGMVEMVGHPQTKGRANRGKQTST